MVGPETAEVIFAGLEPDVSLNQRLAEDLRRLNTCVLWMDDTDADGEGALRLP